MQSETEKQNRNIYCEFWNY